MPTIPAPRISGGIGTYARAARQQCADDHGAEFATVAIVKGYPGKIHSHDADCPTPCYRDCDNALFVWDLTYQDPRTGSVWEATYALSIHGDRIDCWMD